MTAPTVRRMNPQPDKVDLYLASPAGQRMLEKAAEAIKFWDRPYQEETARIRAAYAEWMRRMEMKGK